MRLARDNDVVQTLAPDRPYQPFGKAILPGRRRRNWLVSNAHGSQSACDDGAIDPIAITDHVTRSTVPRKSFGDLAFNPLRCRVGFDVDPDEFSAINPHNHEAVKCFEADGRDHEQIHGGNVRRVVMQEGPPPLAGWPSSLDHVLGDARLRDLKSQFEQLAVNAWRAPKWVLDTHPPDQRAQLRLDWRPPSPSTRFPTPVATKAGPVPTDDRLGQHDRENPEDCWKPTIQLDKEPSIMVRQPDATMQPTPQYDQRMSQHRVLGFKPQLRLKWRAQDG